jgi:hypothetical protein
MKNTSADIQVRCYKKPTRTIPAMVQVLVEARARDMEELPSYVQYNKT